jgi:thiosulfate/3-mercaptopyruvate sulfurtransferase
MTDHLITPDDLAKLIDASAIDASAIDATSVRILDVRWRLDRPDGRPDYLAGHIPGAVYVDLDTELAAHGEPGEGRHPLPSVEALQESARRWGINDGDIGVVYDDLKSMSAARAWWLLRYAGISDVRVLDGSLSGWAASGHALESGEVTPDRGAVTLSYGHLPVLSIDAAAALPESGILLDARAGERYRGEVEPVDPRAGHIPGAVSAPTGENVDDDGRFLPSGTLRARFEALGADDSVGVYCGSGVTAAHEALALTLAGFAPAVYPGSWSQWSNTPGRPVATGEGE